MRLKWNRGRENRTVGVGNRRGGGWRDDPTQCGPSPKATCYQALHRGPPFNLHLNTFQSTHSFAFISPIISENGQMSRQHNAAAYHQPGEAHTWCQFSQPGSIHCRVLIWQLQLIRIQETFQLDLLLVTKLFCSLKPPPKISPSFLSHRNSLCLCVCARLGAMGKREANDSQWLLISTICSALGPLISERKSNMWRESDRQKFSLPSRPIVCWRSAFKHEGPSNFFSLTVSSTPNLFRYKTHTYLCTDLCHSQLLLLICPATESKYFITFSNKQLVWAHEVSSILRKELWR